MRDTIAVCGRSEPRGRADETRARSAENGEALTMRALIHSASQRIVPAALTAVVLAIPATAQEFAAGAPIGALSEAGEWRPMSDNVTVYGSFHFSESCTFNPNKNLILAMNAGNREDPGDNDGYVSLINPDGSVHTPKWIGATRDGLELHDPLGSAVSNGVLYTVDSGYVRLFDLDTGRPLRSVPVPDSTRLNGIAVADDGTVYASNTRPEGQLWKVTANGEVSLFAEGAPLAAPNGVAIDQNGNIVVINVGDNAIITYDQRGAVIQTEHSVEGGNDGVVVTADGTKYVSSRASLSRPGVTDRRRSHERLATYSSTDSRAVCPAALLAQHCRRDPRCELSLRLPFGQRRESTDVSRVRYFDSKVGEEQTSWSISLIPASRMAAWIRSASRASGRDHPHVDSP